MEPREDRIVELSQRLCGEVEVGRREGMTEIEIGAAIGLMLGRMVPSADDRRHIEKFAARHERKSS